MAMRRLLIIWSLARRAALRKCLDLVAEAENDFCFYRSSPYDANRGVAAITLYSGRIN